MDKGGAASIVPRASVILKFAPVFMLLHVIWNDFAIN
jgi:hypothetical protein